MATVVDCVMSRIFSLLVIVASSLVFAALLALNISNAAYYTGSLASSAYHFALPGGLLAASLALLGLSSANRLAAAVSIASIVPALYGAEFYLTGKQAAVADAYSANADRRSKLQVINDLRAAGTDAWPVMRAKSMLIEDGNGRLETALKSRLLPMASMPNHTVVSCNESGQWLIYKSDRHGFNNPDGEWDKKGPGIVMLGDSFAHGSCVPPEKNIAALIRPSLGRVINLGVSGFGPLSELAALREYAAPLSPRDVLWLFFEGNDLTEDTAFERRAPILMRYLKDRGFSQGLFGRSAEIEEKMKKYLKGRMKEAMNRVDNPNEKLINFLRLFHLRERLGISPTSLGVTGDDPDRALELFAKVIAQARAEVQSWGGRLHLVYLPESARYFGSSRDSDIRDYFHARVMKIAARLNLDFMDVDTACGGEADPRTMFVYPGSHYNEKGYLVAAKAILKQIK